MIGLRRLRNLLQHTLLAGLVVTALVWIRQNVNQPHDLYRIGAPLQYAQSSVDDHKTRSSPSDSLYTDARRKTITDSTLSFGASSNKGFEPAVEIDSHPFDNLCQYPILTPNDENVLHVARHIRKVTCKRVQSDVLTFDYDRGQLHFRPEEYTQFTSIFEKSSANDAENANEPTKNLQCFYRPFSGGIIPRRTEITPLSNWTLVQNETTLIGHDLIETRCVVDSKEPNGKTKPKEVFRFAFGHIARKKKKFLKNDSQTLSLDLLVLDSTSLNSMRRHMPKTWAYMTDVMGFFHLEGYTKVGDNSMVNLMPILTGLRYGTQDKSMVSDVDDGTPLDAEKTPFLWSEFKKKGCATMFNDDIAHYTRGFLNYPWKQARGFKEYPTDHFMRPWHIYHRRHEVTGSSKYCFGNYPYAPLQFNFLEQMIKRYNDTCHFSFNFLTDLPHDDPSNLETADDDLLAMLQRLYTGGHLNHTALVIMGDHGNRIGYVMYTYVGRIEERMSLFSIYFPEWFRNAHPDLMHQLRMNKHRLTSNYDVHLMLKDIFRGHFSSQASRETARNGTLAKSLSLFQPVLANRTCADANIPVQHCVCLVPPVREIRLTKKDPLYKLAEQVILNRTHSALEPFAGACRQVQRISISNITILTTNQMIQHGVRDQAPEQMKKLNVKVEGDIQYFDVVFEMQPIQVAGRVRLQHYKKSDKLIVNVEHYTNAKPPFTATTKDELTARPCSGHETKVKPPWFCRCAEVTESVDKSATNLQ